MKKIILILTTVFLLTLVGCKKSEELPMTIEEFVNEMNNEEAKFSYFSKIGNGLTTTSVSGNIDNGVTTSRQNNSLDLLHGKFLFGDNLKFAYASITNEPIGLILENQISILLYYGIALYSIDLNEEDFIEEDGNYNITSESIKYSVSFEYNKAIVISEINNTSSVTTTYNFSINHNVIDNFIINDDAFYFIEEDKVYLLKVFSKDKQFNFKEINGYNIKFIGEGAFSGNNYLEEITLPSSIEYIGAQAFSSCNNLSKVNLNEGLLQIKTGAFNNCQNLVSLTIPTSVTTMEQKIVGANPLDQLQITIYTKLAEKPSGWDENFNNGCIVVYNYI